MLSKAQIKHITALRTKKNRIEHAQFVVEGKKSLIELLKSKFEPLHIYYTKTHESLFSDNNFRNRTCVTDAEITKISTQKTPEGVTAIVKTPVNEPFVWKKEPYIALDKIRDPGNLGTIIRLADWFGINTLLCSTDCVDLYNSKVIQSSMGSIFNIKVEYLDLTHELPKSNLPILGATLSGGSMYNRPPMDKGILIIGNEANGISDPILQLCTEQISIPAKGEAESLNAAMACGILSSHLFR